MMIGSITERGNIYLWSNERFGNVKCFGWLAVGGILILM